MERNKVIERESKEMERNKVIERETSAQQGKHGNIRVRDVPKRV